MAGTDNAICLSIQSKRRTRIPIVRFNPLSPYSINGTGETTGITPDQLNMRRKVEILKYSSNRMPNQTNSLTKKQQWAKLVTQPTRGTIPTTNLNNCVSNVPVSSSASGVPGPYIMLYEDPNVPLYNYTVTRTYAFDVPNETAYWETTVYKNVGLYSGIGGDVFSLNILPTINQPTYTYNIRIPVGLHIDGAIPTNLQAASPASNTVSVSLKTASITVFCNGKNITQQIPQNTVALNKTLTSKLTVNTIPYGTRFNVTQIVDSVSFSGITLSTSAVYIFTFSVKLDFDISINGNIVSKTLQQSNFNGNLFVYAYANVTDDIPIIATNCRVTEPVSPVFLTSPGIFT